jgi:hypothetical protein
MQKITPERTADCARTVAKMASITKRSNGWRVQTRRRGKKPIYGQKAYPFLITHVPQPSILWYKE